MGIIIAKRTEVQQYYDSDRLNQSSLKELQGGLEAYKRKVAKDEEIVENEKEREAFLLGSAIDCILTGNIEDFSREYYVSELEKKPSDVEMWMVQIVFRKLLEDRVENIQPFDTYRELIGEAAVEVDWYKGNPGEKRTDTFISNAKEYFQDLIYSNGKKVLSLTQKTKIDNVVESLKNSPNTAKYFDRQTLSSNQLVDVYYQKPIYFKYGDVECKALPDLIIVFKNPANNGIEGIQIVDLKTMSGDTLNFLSNVKRFRYDIQMAWYMTAVEREFKVDSSLIKNPIFVVESTTQPGTPLVYHMSNSLITMGYMGRKEFEIPIQFSDTPVHFRPIPGIIQLMEEYLFYVSTQWEKDIIIAKAEGDLHINWNKIL